MPLAPINQARELQWFVHKPCACNHMNALFGRVGKCTPIPCPMTIKEILAPLSMALAAAVGRHSPVPYYDVYRGMPRKKFARYQQAEQQLKRQGRMVTREQGRIEMFVKIEGIQFNPAKPNPDCRAIQFRRPEYTLQLASHIKKAEHALYAVRDVPGFGYGRLFAKNMNPAQRAQALHEKYWSFGEVPNVVEFDASRFDAHVNPHILGNEHLFWRLTCTGHQLDDLLKWQAENECSFTVGQFKQWYDVKGGRMSGDANTAAGNCQIMACLLAAFGNHLGVKFTFLCDGDDSVFFYVGPPFTDADVDAFFSKFGFTMKIENRPTTFEDINFCQSKPVKLNGEWTMVRNPYKILSKIGVSPKTADPRGRLKYIRTVALGELSLVRGCPVLDPFLTRVIKVCDAQLTDRQRKRGVIHKAALTHFYRLSQFVPEDWQVLRNTTILASARESFHRAWGIGVEHQVQLEATFERWVFDLARTREENGLDVAKWLPPVFHPERW